MRRMMLVACLTVTVLVAAGATLAARLVPAIAAERALARALLEEHLRHDVRHGSVALGWEEGLVVRVGGLEVGPRRDPLLTAPDVRVHVDVRRVLRSWGGEIDVQLVELRHPTLRLQRDAEGRWRLDDVVTTAAPATLEQLAETLRATTLPAVAVTDGELLLDDGLHTRRLRVGDVHATLDGLRRERGGRLLVEGLLDDGGTAAPFNLEALVAPMTEPGVPPMSLAVSVSPVDLASWSSLVPWRGVHPVEGLLRADLRGAIMPGGTGAMLRGRVNVDGLTLAQGDVVGEPGDVRVDVDLAGEPDLGRYVVHRLDVTAPFVSLRTRLQVEDWSLDGVREADVALEISDVAGLRAALPADVAPPGWDIAGPVDAAIRVDANGWDVDVGLDQARVRHEDMFDKPRGTPMHVRLDGERRGTRLWFPAAEVMLDDVVLAGTVDLPLERGGPFVVALDTGEVPIRRLARVLPELRRALRKPEHVQGKLQLSLAANLLPNGERYRAEMALRGVDLRLRRTVLRGNTRLSVEAHDDGRTVRTTVQAPLRDLRLYRLDATGRPWLDKPRGLPMDVLLRLTTTRDRVDVEHAEVRLGRVRVQGYGTAAPELRLHVPDLELPFDDVRRVFAVARAVPAGAVLRGPVTLTGSAHLLTAELPALELTTAKSRFVGAATVHDLDDPVVDAQFRQVVLDLPEVHAFLREDLLPVAGTLRGPMIFHGRLNDPATFSVVMDPVEGELPDSRFDGSLAVEDLRAPKVRARLRAERLTLEDLAGHHAEALEVRNSPHGLPTVLRHRLARVRLDVDLRVREMRTGIEVLRDVETRFVLNDGALAVRSLRAGVRGGTVRAWDSRVDLRPVWASGRWNLELRGVDVAALSSVVGMPVLGSLNADLVVKTRGRTTEDILENLDGTIRFHAPVLETPDVNLVQALRSPVRRVLPLVRGEGAAEPRITAVFHDVSGEGRIAGGVLTLTRPMTLTSPLGAVTLSGTVRLDGTLDLQGSTELQPQQVAMLTGGRYLPAQARSTPLTITGTVREPAVHDVDPRSFVGDEDIPRVLNAAALTAVEARQAVAREARRARAQAAEEDRRLDDRARADAQRAAEELRRRAEELRRRAAPR